MNINEIIIKEPVSQNEFNEYYNIRWEILRKPLGGSLNSTKDDLENVSIH